MSSDFRHGKHVVSKLHAHLVFVTKRRGKIFTEAHLQALETIFRKLCEDFETELSEFNGEADHVHLLVEYPPKVCISSLVNSLKGVSSRRIKQQFPEISAHWAVRKSENALWSPSYFAGSVGGAPIEILKRYIEDQKRPG
jgi:putative transposase